MPCAGCRESPRRAGALARGRGAAPPTPRLYLLPLTGYKVQQELLDLWEEDHKTVVYVTHDVEEAILLSDRILILSPQPGRVIAEFRVPFSRPREAGLTLSEELLHLKRQISAALGMRTDHPHAVTT